MPSNWCVWGHEGEYPCISQEEYEPNRRVQGGTKEQMAASIKETGSSPVPEVKSNIHCLTIVGQIEGHLVLPPQNKTTKYEHVIPQLVALEQSPEIEGVLVILNTVGGDVEAGLAIAEMIASLSKPTVSLVLGGGHSIGVPIVPLSHLLPGIRDKASHVLSPTFYSGRPGSRLVKHVPWRKSQGQTNPL